MSRTKCTYIVDLLLVASVVFFLSSPAHASHGAVWKPLKAEQMWVLEDYWYEKKEPIPYLDIQVSKWLNPWTQYFEILREKAEVNRLDAKIIENNQYRDLQNGIGLGFIVGGCFLWLLAHEAYLKVRQGRSNLT